MVEARTDHHPAVVVVDEFRVSLRDNKFAVTTLHDSVAAAAADFFSVGFLLFILSSASASSTHFLGWQSKVCYGGECILSFFHSQ